MRVLEAAIDALRQYQQSARNEGSGDVSRACFWTAKKAKEAKKGGDNFRKWLAAAQCGRFPTSAVRKTGDSQLRHGIGLHGTKRSGFSSEVGRLRTVAHQSDAEALSLCIIASLVLIKSAQLRSLHPV